MVPHDKIKAAARERMARTGESYVGARYEAIKAHAADREDDFAPNTSGFVAVDVSPLMESIGRTVDVGPVAESIRQAMDIGPVAESIRQAMDIGPVAESIRQAMDVGPVAESIRQAMDVGPVAESIRQAMDIARWRSRSVRPWTSARGGVDPSGHGRQSSMSGMSARRPGTGQATI